MKQFKFNTRSGKYTVKLQETGKVDNNGHILTEYVLVTHEGYCLFHGKDLGCSPLHTPEGKDNAIALLSFLTLKPGDTDQEYFDPYTPEQIEWCQGGDAEDLAMMVDDYENK